MSKRLKYLLLSAAILLAIILAAESMVFYRAVKPKPGPPKTQTFTNTIMKLGQEDEFTIGKDEKIFYENQASTLPKINYRISIPGKVLAGSWLDLKVGDNVNLVITYDDQGNPTDRTLIIYR